MRAGSHSVTLHAECTQTAWSVELLLPVQPTAWKHRLDNRKHKTQHRTAASTKRTAPADHVLVPSVSLQPRDSGVSPVLSQAKEGREREQSSISSVSLWPRAAGGEYATWPQANACRAANTPSHSRAPIFPVSLGPQG